MADAISNRKTFGVIMFWDTTANRKIKCCSNLSVSKSDRPEIKIVVTQTKVRAIWL